MNVIKKNGVVSQDDGNSHRMDYMVNRTVASPEDLLIQIEEAQLLGATEEELVQMHERYTNAH